MSNAAVPPEGRATVMVAEGETAAAEQLIQALVAGGHEGVLASDGSAALRLLPTRHFDLVLCASRLPDTDGFDVCNAIRTAPATSHVPVVLLSGVVTDTERERAIRAGAQGLAVTPLEREVLLTLVSSYLSRSSLRSRLSDLEGLVVTLARALDDRDVTTAGLSARVAHWSAQLGAAVGLPDHDLTELYKTALVHDIGRIGVSQAILAKPGPLDPAEFTEVRRHPEFGAELLKPMPDAEALLEAVRHHHERIDGDGYPTGLRGDQISLFARIIAIADAFVAMTTDRPYRSRMSLPEAIRVLQGGAGTQFDERLINRFLEVLRQDDTRPAHELETAG